MRHLDRGRSRLGRRLVRGDTRGGRQHVMMPTVPPAHKGPCVLCIERVVFNYEWTLRTSYLDLMMIK